MLHTLFWRYCQLFTRFKLTEDKDAVVVGLLRMELRRGTHLHFPGH